MASRRDRYQKPSILHKKAAAVETADLETREIEAPPSGEAAKLNP